MHTPPNKKPRPPTAEEIAKGADSRRVHQIEAGKIGRDVDALQAALVESNANIYQRSGILVRIVKAARDSRESDRIQRRKGTPTIDQLPLEHLAELGERLIRWEKWDKRSAQWVAAVIPNRVPSTLQARGDWPFHHLEGISECPMLRRDGTVAQAPGFDAGTGYFLALEADFPPIPEQPSMDDVQRAIAALKVPFAGFPFIGPQYCSAILAALLTQMARAAINGNVPIFGASAPSPRTGKTLAVDVVSTIVTGRKAARLSPSRSEEEDSKTLMASAIAGDSLVLFDNIPSGQPFGSGPLAMAVTSAEIRGRILGKTEMRSAPWQAMIMVTGNNLQFIADLQQRTIPIMLDAKVERPEERADFPEDRQGEDRLLAWVLARRPSLVSAALTILRGYVAAGCPSQGLSMFGGFDSWNRLVRPALVWAGEPDPLEGRNKIACGVDPDRDNHGVLLRTWHQYFGGSAKTISEVQAHIHELNEAKRHAEALILVEACNNVLRQPPHNEFMINNRSLGRHLAAKKDWIVGGLRFVEAGQDRNGVKSWKVEQWDP